MKKVFNFLVITCFVTGIVMLTGCKKDPEIPTVTTTAVSAITTTTATTGGDVTSDGGAEVTAKGVCWGTSANPEVTGSHTTDGTGTGPFSSNLTGLTAGATYHVRAYATNSAGTAYGNDVTFATTAIVGATVTTNATVGSITATSAVSGGNVTADGGDAVTARGVCWGTGATPDITGTHTTDGAGLGTFTSNIAGLSAGQAYNVRAYATNGAGTTYGSVVSFTTPADKATLTTTAVTDPTGTTAMSGGNITATGGSAITNRGVCWGTSSGPTIENDEFTDEGPGSTGVFTSEMTGLEAYTTYFVRAYATNSAGIQYGNEVTFTTALADADGNIYTTVTIGDQVWMVENLRTTKYNDGSDIPLVTVAGSWTTLTTAAYCWYGNDETTNKPLYGAMYNWYAANNDALCPAGWHVPTDEEFKALEIALGMSAGDAELFGWRGTDQGTELKSATGWSNNGNGTNTSGFTAFPGGVRYYDDGGFFGAGTLTYFWCADEANLERSYYRRLNAATVADPDVVEERVSRERAVKTAGKSVRCLKDN